MIQVKCFPGPKSLVKNCLCLNLGQIPTSWSDYGKTCSMSTSQIISSKISNCVSVCEHLRALFSIKKKCVELWKTAGHRNIKCSTMEKANFNLQVEYSWISLRYTSLPVWKCMNKSTPFQNLLQFYKKGECNENNWQCRKKKISKLTS